MEGLKNKPFMLIAAEEENKIMDISRGMTYCIYLNEKDTEEGDGMEQNAQYGTIVQKELSANKFEELSLFCTKLEEGIFENNGFVKNNFKSINKFNKPLIQN